MVNETIAKIKAILANIAQLSRTTPERWKNMLNMMLEKMAGNNNVEKLCIRMLFEADFNNNNKWLGSAVMAAAETHSLMAIEQYRSRKRKSVGIQCLNKRLFYNLHHFLQQPAALCSNDAKSCYNWIILIIAALCLCQLGASKEAVYGMVNTLGNLKHHIRMAYGDSEISQDQQEWEQPTVGIGQGNGAGPQIWAAVSSPLFEIL